MIRIVQVLLRALALQDFLSILQKTILQTVLVQHVVYALHSTVYSIQYNQCIAFPMGFALNAVLLIKSQNNSLSEFSVGSNHLESQNCQNPSS